MGSDPLSGKDVKAPNGEEGPTEPGPPINNLNIGQLHFHGNDLAELRRIAEYDPDLAQRIVDQRDREDGREHASFRLGLIVSAILAVAVVAAIVFLLVEKGIIATLLAVLAILAIALLVRVVLTGEWSDTSWFGRGVHALVRLLGGKPED